MKYNPEKISPEKVKAASEEMMRLGQSLNASERAKYDRLKKEAKVLREIASKHLTSYPLTLYQIYSREPQSSEERRKQNPRLYVKPSKRNRLMLKSDHSRLQDQILKLIRVML